MSSLFELKKKGRVLRKHLELIFGTEVTLSQAYEALAAMEGKSDWNTLVASVHARPDQGTSEFIQRNAQSLVIVPHWAEFVSWTKDAGYDESYLDINESKCLALQEQYLQERNEMPKDEPPKIPCRYCNDTGLVQPGKWRNTTGQPCTHCQASYVASYHQPSVLKLLEVNLVDVLDDYDSPRSTPEWTWIEEHHSFAHADNDNDQPSACFEFMVNVELALEANDGIPPLLRPFFDKAKAEGAIWVLFNQG